MRGFLMLAATGEDPRSRMKTSAKSSAHLPPTGRQNVLREPIPVAWSTNHWEAEGRNSRPRCTSILMEAVAKLPHGAYVAAFSSICTHLAAKCAFYISRTNQYDFSTFRLNDDTKQPKVHVRSTPRDATGQSARPHSQAVLPRHAPCTSGHLHDSCGH